MALFPGSTDLPEPSDYVQTQRIQAIQADIVEQDPFTYDGAETADLGPEWFTEESFGTLHFTPEGYSHVADRLAASVAAYVGVLPNTTPLKPDPDAYWFAGQLYPDPTTNLEPICIAAREYFDKFFQKLEQYGYSFVNSVAYEILSFFMPEDWKQRNFRGDAAQSGWVPPSSFIQPTNDDALNYIARVQNEVIRIGRKYAVDIKFQTGEPWWWDGSYNTGIGRNAPCIYDSRTTGMYKLETGNDVPTPWIEDIFAPLDPVQLPYVEWLQHKLGRSTNYIRDMVKEENGGYGFNYGNDYGGLYSLEATLLFFSPQIMSPASELTKILNFPVDEWRAPNYDFVQIEDYDWIIDGRLDLVPLTFDAATEKLGYPRSLVHYFAGFILNGQDYHIWPWINTAMRMARRANMAYVYIWSWTQVSRDGIFYDDLPRDATSAPILDLPPNWDAKYTVERSYRTEIIESDDGTEQRSSLRRWPRKAIEFTTLSDAGDQRRIDIAMAGWQNRMFIFPELQRRTKSTTAMSDIDIGLEVENVPGWLQLDAVVILSQPATAERRAWQDARVVARIDGNRVEFTEADANGVDWPAGTMIYAAVYGKMGAELNGRQLSDSVMELPIRFEVNPGNEIPSWHPAAPPVTFLGLELWTKEPNWVNPVNVGMIFPVDKNDFDKGVVDFFRPIKDFSRTLKFTYLNQSTDEADDMDAFFERRRGMAVPFYMPTWKRDLQLSQRQVGAAANELIVQGAEVAQYISNNRIYRNVALVTRDKQVFPYVVSAMTADVLRDDTKLTLAANVPPEVMGNLAMICWCPLWRLASDTLTAVWETNTISQYDLSMQTLVDSER